MTCLHSKSASYAHLAVQRALMQTRVAAVRLQVQREYFQANAPAPQLTTTMASMHNAKPARSRVCNVQVPQFAPVVLAPQQRESWLAFAPAPPTITVQVQQPSVRRVSFPACNVRVPPYVLPA